MEPNSSSARPIVLVVEDDRMDRDLIGKGLAPTYEVIYAPDGPTALALFEERKPSLVLLDLRLPGISGFEILEKIRTRSDSLKDVHVIIISNLDEQSQKERARALGIDDYIVKADVSVDQIAEKAREALGQ